MPNVELSAEQAKAYHAARSFLRGKGQTFTLHGLAGSGKTTVMAQIAHEVPSAILCTLTGKAAAVLRDKTGIDACTIHSAFYRLEKITKDKNKRIMHWRNAMKDDGLSGGVVLLDECSMVNSAMARDILATGAKVIASGDPGQLPPVSGQQHFNTPDAMLTEIHRQALESPIIRQAHAVRNTGKYTADGEAFRVSSQATDEDLLAADVLLTWTHKTRRAANAEMRRLRGFWMPHPQEGEPVMCLRNNPEFSIYNGAVYTLARKMRDGDEDIQIIVDGRLATIPRAAFTGVRTKHTDDQEGVTPFDFGYAMTVHKAQGSEWRQVILMDEFRGTDDERRKWLYTGITRASEAILIVR